MRFLLITLFLCAISYGQTNTYTISFENAAHHEAEIKATFPNLKTKTVTARMSRTSPGRYALHEFAKNVYAFKATNSKGEVLPVKRPDPYSWEITGHDGTVHIRYTLFANRGDGTYSQVDDTHAHLNMPATFIFMDTTEERPIEVTFDTKDTNWKVATQLRKLSDTKYSAPNLYYFLDSPTEVSDYQLREFTVDGQNIRFVLHSPDSSDDFDTYWEEVKAIIHQQKAVFGELPAYDFGEYTFLACYITNASGDGMEHRNSTVLTDTETLAEGGMTGNIGTVSHEYFHSWNVERIRPTDLEPFDFKAANMSEGLWFAEGFTSYYTGLILTRAGVITAEKYIKGLNGGFNYVWNSPAREFFNPIEMSYQAPFVDAAKSVDPVNRGNTFISYYSYGSVLGLALDLSLREEGLNLDDYFKKVWEAHGKNEVAYTVQDLEKVLGEYAGDAFAKAFFSNYIYNSEMPDYARLFSQVGVAMERNDTKAFFGARLVDNEKGLKITRGTQKGSPAYIAGLDTGDLLTAIDGKMITKKEDFETLLATMSVGQKMTVTFERFGQTKTTEVTLASDPTYTISLEEKVSRKLAKNRSDWLEKK
ncbi:MAG: putative metalloprotease with PDZ domain [Flavobacteriales bacterium]|jgi:predicted metalloprotease with PDZ domain